MSTTPIQLPALRPPEYYSPFDARAKLMNLQNLAQQQQIGQQQLQVGQMSIEEHNRALAQQQAINQAHKDAWTIGADGKPQFDKGKFTQALATGGHGSAIPGIMEGYTKYEKSLADLGKVKGEVAALEQNAAGAFGAAAQSANNDPHVFLTLMKSAVNNEALTEDHVKPFVDDVTAALGYDPSGQVARGLVKKYTDLMIAGSTKQQELGTQRRTSESTVTRNLATAGAADVNSLKGRLEIAAQTMPVSADPQAPIDPAAWTAWREKQKDDVKAYIPPQPTPTSVAIVKNLGLTMDQRRQAEQAKATLEETKKRDEANIGNTETELAVIATNPKETPERRAAAGAALKRLDQSKVASRPIINNLIPGVPTAPATGAAAQLHGDDFLKTLPPSFAARIKAIATGNELAPTGRAAMTGPGGQMMSVLYQYDPEFTPLLAQQRKETLKEFTSTQVSHAGGQLLALNTMIHHADLYLDAAAALKNGTFKPGNEIYNKIATIFGAAPPTNAALLAQFLAGETGKVATGGVPAEGEINRILHNMSTSGSPEAMQSAGEKLIQIAAGRMVPLKERRDNARLEKFVPILGPDAKEILQRRGFDPETMKPATGGRGKIEKWGYDSRGQLVRQ